MGYVPSTGSTDIPLNLSTSNIFITNVYGIMYSLTEGSYCPVPYVVLANNLYTVQLFVGDIGKSSPYVRTTVGDSIWHDVYKMKIIVILEYTKT